MSAWLEVCNTCGKAFWNRQLLLHTCPECEKEAAEKPESIARFASGLQLDDED